MHVCSLGIKAKDMYFKALFPPLTDETLMKAEQILMILAVIQ